MKYEDEIKAFVEWRRKHAMTRREASVLIGIPMYVIQIYETNQMVSKEYINKIKDFIKKPLEDYNPELMNMLKLCRQYSDMTRKQLSRKLNITVNTLKNVEIVYVKTSYQKRLVLGRFITETLKKMKEEVDFYLEKSK